MTEDKDLSFWISTSDDNDQLEINGETFTSIEELYRILEGPAKELGVSVSDLDIGYGSSLDFLECDVDNPATVALAWKINGTSWLEDYMTTLKDAELSIKESRAWAEDDDELADRITQERQELAKYWETT